mmetsp:Transcript_13560/g.39057  ORF Transcript_13560/g.39057 Transcript_13560/m.39057 type:complete len:258 (-) Transcript_13560:2884-3657(-)
MGLALGPKGGVSEHRVHGFPGSTMQKTEHADSPWPLGSTTRTCGALFGAYNTVSFAYLENPRPSSWGSSPKVVSNACDHGALGSATWKTCNLPVALSTAMTNKCSLKVKDRCLAVFENVAGVLSTGHLSAGRCTSAAQTFSSPDSRFLKSANNSPRAPQRIGTMVCASLNFDVSGQGCHRNSRPRRHVASNTFAPPGASCSGSSGEVGTNFRRCMSTGASKAAGSTGGGMTAIGGSGPPRAPGGNIGGPPFPIIGSR